MLVILKATLNRRFKFTHWKPYCLGRKSVCPQPVEYQPCSPSLTGSSGAMQKEERLFSRLPFDGLGKVATEPAWICVCECKWIVRMSFRPDHSMLFKHKPVLERMLPVCGFIGLCASPAGEIVLIRILLPAVRRSYITSATLALEIAHLLRVALYSCQPLAV